MPEHEELLLQSNDALTLYAQKWLPQSSPRAVIYLIHGLGEHSGRYQRLAERLTASGFAIITFDLRGHGRSSGLRGDTPNFDFFADDLSILIDKNRKTYSHLPAFIYGHSLGGLISLYYLVQRQPAINGAVITSPGLRIPGADGNLKILMATVGGSLLPRLSIANGLDLQGLSRDPAVIKAYLNDPYVHDRITLRMGKAMFRAIDYVFKNLPEIEVPILLMHGGADRITMPEGSKELAELIKGDCRLKIWDSYYHELHNEPEKELVFAFIEDWLSERLA